MALLDQILGPLEIALNRALATSPAALDKLKSTHDVVALQFRDLGWGLRIAPAPHGVQLLAGTGEARATVSTSLVGMARLMAGEDARSMGNALMLDGDAEYAAQLMDAMRSARFDLEAEIRSLLDPVLSTALGQNLGQGVKEIVQFGKQSLHSLLFGAAAQAGSGDVPQTVDGEVADSQQTHAWMDEVDDAATALDRLEARLARLEQQRGDA